LAVSGLALLAGHSGRRRDRAPPRERESPAAGAGAPPHPATRSLLDRRAPPPRSSVQSVEDGRAAVTIGPAGDRSAKSSASRDTLPPPSRVYMSPAASAELVDQL